VLGSAPACSARLPTLPVACDWPLLVSCGCLRVTVAQLPALLGTQPPAGRGARPLPPYPVAQPPPSRCLRRTPHANKPPFSQQQGDVCAETACCKHLFKVSQIFQRYVASVSYGRCKNRLGCRTCCNVVHVGCKLMFSIFHLFFSMYVANIFI
jgi:hypothetical protein